MQEKVTDVDGKHSKVKMRVEDWDIIGQCTASLMTIAELFWNRTSAISILLAALFCHGSTHVLGALQRMFLLSRLGWALSSADRISRVISPMAVSNDHPKAPVRPEYTPSLVSYTK